MNDGDKKMCTDWSTDSKEYCNETTTPHYGFSGDIMGVNNGVYAYVNCSACWKRGSMKDCTEWSGYAKKEDTGLKEDYFTGYQFQCVEYSRRWLINVYKCTYGEIKFAAYIFDQITHVQDLVTGGTKPFVGYPNENAIAPRFGDVLIFPIDESKDQNVGHVAIITGVNEDKWYYEISEQNNENYWEEPKSYARRMIMIVYEGKFTLTEFAWSEDLFTKIKGEGLETEYINAKEGKLSVTGWKRIE